LELSLWGATRVQRITLVGYGSPEATPCVKFKADAT
jgi:hypothetical protein